MVFNVATKYDSTPESVHSNYDCMLYSSVGGRYRPSRSGIDIKPVVKLSHNLDYYKYGEHVFQSV